MKEDWKKEVDDVKTTNHIKDCKIRSGFRVIGPNTADGKESTWYMPTIGEANSFAEQLAKTTDKEVDVCKYLGSFRKAKPPIEFVPATDIKEE